MMETGHQHFLAHHYGWASAAQLLLGRSDATDAGAGPGRAWFRSDTAGISYSMPGEPHGPGSYQHRVTFAAIGAHMAAQPAARVAELQEAVRLNAAESRRWWAAMSEIHPNWYSRPDPAVRAALRTEDAAHHRVADELASRIHAAVLAVLPLHDQRSGEPTNLIEWAEALSISESRQPSTPGGGDAEQCSLVRPGRGVDR